MSLSTPERLRQLSEGYDLDGGGYAFENPPHPELKDLGVVIWDDPDPDYIPWIRDLEEHDFNDLSCPIYAFYPNGPGFGSPMPEGWPMSITHDDGWVWDIVGAGSLNETDHDCNCHGIRQCPNCEQEAPYDDANFCPACGTGYEDEGGHLRKDAWKFTGNVKDKPFKDCARCEGEGYVVSEGGEWALYALHELEEDDGDEDQEDEAGIEECDPAASPGEEAGATEG